MKKQKLIIARRTLFALTLAWMIAIPTATLRAQSSEPPTNQEQETAQPSSFSGQCDWLCQLRERQAQQLEGSWAMTVTPVPPPGAPPLPNRHLYVTFARGGVYIGFDRNSPFSSPQHGVWEHRGGNEFAWTSIQDLFDAMGNFQGTLKIRARITLTGKDEFVGVANPQVRDAAGNITLDACSTFKAERIKTEPLSPRCQSITPPQ
jgi:hypothetical protein